MKLLYSSHRVGSIFSEELERRMLLSASPTPTLEAQPVVSAGNTIQSFVITYADPSGISGSSLSRANIAVTGPAGQSLTVSYAEVIQNSGGTAEVEYSVNSPGGTYVPAQVFSTGDSASPYSAGSGTAASFTAADNGVYTVSMNANSVYDSSGVAVPAGPIGTFTVNVPSASVTTASFQHTVIDPTPRTLPVSKGLIDIYGNGDQEPIVGHNDGSGLYWYAPQTAGDLTGPWVKHAIANTGDFYEDLQVADINGDGYEDIIASVGTGNGQYSMYWLENPLGYGGDPTQPWQQFLIGQGLGHNFSLADLDRDGKLDVITQRAIYFQNSPTSWTEVDAPQLNMGDLDGEATFDALNNGDIDVIGISNDPGHPLAWFENPLNTGGNPRTDVWQQHIIGPGYDSGNGGNSVSFITGDFTGDGRTDIVTAPSERDSGSPYAPPGGLILWQAPADPLTQTFTPITIDSSYTDVHKVDVADMNGDGYLDIVVAEQEQSVSQRIAIFYNVGGTGQEWQQQVLANTGDQNIRVGDLNDDGRLDIFGSNHGDFGAAHPVEAFIQTGSAISSSPAAPADLRAYRYDDSAVTLSWQDESSLINGYQNALGFVVERSTDDVNFTQVAQVGVGTSTYTDTAAPAGAVYYYRVAATDSAGLSGFSDVAGSDGSTTLPAPTPSDGGTQVGQLTSKGAKPGKLTFTTTAGTAVTLTLTAGSATVSQNADGSIDLDLDSRGNAKLTVTTRGGRNAVAFDRVAITGTLAQFTGTTATLAGLFSASGAIKNLRAAQITGTVAASGNIGSITAGSLASGAILAGASFTDGTALADATFASGSIGTVKITGVISDSVISAGVAPASTGQYATAGDQDFGGVINTISAKSGADASSLFLADQIKHAKLPKPVDVATDPRFVIL